MKWFVIFAISFFILQQEISPTPVGDLTSNPNPTNASPVNQNDPNTDTTPQNPQKKQPSDAAQKEPPENNSSKADPNDSSNPVEKQPSDAAQKEPPENNSSKADPNDSSNPVDNSTAKPDDISVPPDENASPAEPAEDSDSTPTDVELPSPQPNPEPDENPSEEENSTENAPAISTLSTDSLILVNAVDLIRSIASEKDPKKRQHKFKEATAVFPKDRSEVLYKWFTAALKSPKKTLKKLDNSKISRVSESWLYRAFGNHLVNGVGYTVGYGMRSVGKTISEIGKLGKKLGNLLKGTTVTADLKNKELQLDIKKSSSSKFSTSDFVIGAGDAVDKKGKRMVNGVKLRRDLRRSFKAIRNLFKFIS